MPFLLDPYRYAGGASDPFGDVISALSGNTDADAWDSTVDTYQTSGGSAAGNGDPVGSWLGGVNGYEFLQSTAGERPVLQTDGLQFDGSDDSLICTDFTMSGITAHAVLVRLKTSDTQAMVMYGDGGGAWLCPMEDGSTSTSIENSIGTPTFYINNSSGWGTTRDDLHTGLATGSHEVFRSSGTNFSNVTSFRLCWFSSAGFRMNGYVDKVLICADSDYTSNQSTIDTWMGL